MKIRIMLTVLSGLWLLPVGLAVEEPKVQLLEKTAPWGVTVERESFYTKGGEKVLHGIYEMLTDDGGNQIRGNYIDGEPDGPYVLYYEGLGTKQSEDLYAKGDRVGKSRTWDTKGNLLFEGAWKDGEPWDGWFEFKNSSTKGAYHQRGESWEITQWKNGKKVPGSTREVTVKWRDWVPGKLPNPDLFCRWHWAQFSDPKDYPFITEMPSYGDVPFLIERCAKKEPHYEIAWEQLMALTRVGFGNPWLQKENELRDASAQWREWWEEVGRNRPELRKTRGVRDQAAWDMIRGGRDLPLPDVAVVIPEAYELTVHFRTGDYGVKTETITIKRTGEGAELIRSLSARRDGPVTEERWLPFDSDDADRVLRAIGYLSDNPWLINDEKKIEREYWEAEKLGEKSLESNGKRLQIGRESYGQLYHPVTEFELRDSDGKLWWNADVDDWSGGNPERFNHSHQAAPGVVFPFLARIFPESERRENGKGRGWMGK